MAVKMLKTKILPLLIGTFVAGMVLTATDARADSLLGAWLRAVDTQYPWCAEYFGPSASTNCGFMTWRQCMADISGVGGMCHENAAYIGPPRRHRAHRHRRAHR
jgi:hypothetical protein